MVSQPVQQRVDELLSGARAQIVAKIFGEDMDVLRDKADRIAAVLRTVQGIKDLRVELVSGRQSTPSPSTARPSPGRASTSRT
jgi:cobalt-zinc-cadmium resistance protein CzcA